MGVGGGGGGGGGWSRTETQLRTSQQWVDYITTTFGIGSGASTRVFLCQQECN